MEGVAELSITELRSRRPIGGYCAIMRRRSRSGARIAVLLIALALGGAAVWASTMRRRVEEARYDVDVHDGDFEVRTYAPRVIAETDVRGPERDALNEGFRRLAAYIFGKNSARGEVAMTTPVAARRTERVAMTAPVEQIPAGEGTWIIAFTMPSDRTLATLPAPTDERVVLRPLPPVRYAAVRFGGGWSEARDRRETERLRAWMTSRGLEARGAPEIARYDPPWTPPFLRRNEILVPIV